MIFSSFEEMDCSIYIDAFQIKKFAFFEFFSKIFTSKAKAAPERLLLQRI